MISLTFLYIVGKYNPFYNLCGSNFTFADAATILIAIIALLFSIQQGYHNRRHNRLTVKPILQLEFKFQGDIIGIGVKNSGKGPSLKTKLTIKNAKGDEIKIPKLYEAVKNDLKLNDPRNYFQGITDSIITSKDQLKVFEIYTENKFTNSDFKTFFNVCKNHTFNFTYFDLYGNTYSHLEFIDPNLEDYLVQNRERW